MKLLSFIVNGKASYGVLTDAGIVDLGSRLGDVAPDLKALLASGIEQAEEFASVGVDYQLADVELLPVIPNPEDIWVVGMNTFSHMEEVNKIGIEKPQFPTLIHRGAKTLVASGDTMEIAKAESFPDYEGEIALIIGKSCRNVSADEALDYVAGYSCFNDGSGRHYQMTSTQMTAGKNGYRSGAFGPCMATTDSIKLEDLEVSTKVNGEDRQRMKLDDLIFSFGELVAFISEFTWLAPGDVIVTGSPSGVGVFQGKKLEAGDKVEITASGIGTLTNNMVDQE